MELEPKTDLAIAGGAIAMALIDTLTTKGILTKAEAVAVLSAAQNRCMARPSSVGAARICGTATQAFRDGK